jgi:hypothetical protein
MSRAGWQGERAQNKDVAPATVFAQARRGVNATGTTANVTEESSAYRSLGH